MGDAGLGATGMLHAADMFLPMHGCSAGVLQLKNAEVTSLLRQYASPEFVGWGSDLPCIPTGEHAGKRVGACRSLYLQGALEAAKIWRQTIRYATVSWGHFAYWGKVRAGRRACARYQRGI